jgi:hypothetical protein
MIIGILKSSIQSQANVGYIIMMGFRTIDGMVYRIGLPHYYLLFGYKWIQLDLVNKNICVVVKQGVSHTTWLNLG